MTPVSVQTALDRPRQLGIRVALEQRFADVSIDDLQALRQLVSRHGALCIEGQPVTPGQLREFTARWGSVIELPAALALDHQEPGLPCITRVGNLRVDGSIIPALRLAEYWHHDGDFWAPGQNFILNFLSCARVPSVGGQTGLLDMRLGYETLGDAERSELDAAFVWVRAREIDDFKTATPDELPPDVRHPVVVRHPLTDQPALYLPASSTGVQIANSERVLDVDTLVEATRQRLGSVEHVWAAGDLLIIDNLQVMHRSMGGYGDHPRLLYRCQARCGGSKERALAGVALG